MALEASNRLAVPVDLSSACAVRFCTVVVLRYSMLGRPLLLVGLYYPTMCLACFRLRLFRLVTAPCLFCLLVGRCIGYKSHCIIRGLFRVRVNEISILGWLESSMSQDPDLACNKDALCESAWRIR